MISALVLFAAEYLAFRQGGPVFQASELRILVGHGALDFFQHPQFDHPGSSPAEGLIDRLFWMLSRVRNGPIWSSFRLSIPKWSHFSKGNNF